MDIIRETQTAYGVTLRKFKVPVVRPCGHKDYGLGERPATALADARRRAETKCPECMTEAEWNAGNVAMHARLDAMHAMEGGAQ